MAKGGNNTVDKESGKKPIYKKWWFWVIIVGIVLAIYAIAVALTDEETMEELGLSSQDEEEIEEEQEDEEIVEIDNIVFEWICDIDVTHERIEEDKILYVGNEGNEEVTVDGYLDEGNYTIYCEDFFDDVDLWGRDYCKAHNRQYDVEVAHKAYKSYNELIRNCDKDGVEIKRSQVFAYSYNEPIDVELVEGDYVYIMHTANEKASWGNIYIKKN